MNKTIKKFNIIAIICIIIFGITLSQKAFQNDTFYTIKLGEHIIEKGYIDMQDTFSIHDGLTYTYPHWMYDTGIYLIYDLGSNIASTLSLNPENGGFTAIYISTMFFAIFLGILIYYSNIKISNNHVISFFITLGVMYCLRNYIAARAQLATFICFTLEILFIEQLLKTGKVKYGIGLFVVAILIANLHAAVWYMFFILALPYIAEFFIIKLMESNLSCRIQLKILNSKKNRYEKDLVNVNNDEIKEKINQKIENINIKIDSLNSLMEKRKEAVIKMENNSKRLKYIKRKNIKLLIIVLIICIFSGLLTPQTSFEPYTHLFKLLKGNSTENISEHLPIVLINSNEALALFVIILMVLIFTDIKISLKDLFMLLGLTILTLMSRRQLSLLALMGAYSINILISNFINKYDKINVEEKILNKFTTKFGMTIIILLAIFCGVTFFGKKYKEKYVDESSYPVGVSEYILHNLEVNKIRLYNSYNFGSYLLYKNIPVFIDSRCDLYTPEFNNKDIFSDALNIEGLSVYYEDMFDHYNVTHIITYDDSKLEMILSHDDNYRIIYKDDNFHLFERIVTNKGENSKE